MSRSVQIKLLVTAVIPLSLGIIILSSSRSTGQQAVDASAFKLSGVTTDCIVPRFAKRAVAGTVATVGPEGGESLTDAEARAAYNCAKAEMLANYGKSGSAAAAEYANWTNYSTSPYVSATHGNRYVNNYANDIGRNYGQYEKAGALPVGSILAKDSFVVNSKGQVVISVLSLMEKMPVEFNSKFQDWRYTMILPDGRQVGTTGGAGSKNVDFCGGCHGVVDSSLFFVPKDYRYLDREQGGK